MTGSESQEIGRDPRRLGPGPALLLEVARRLEDAAQARACGLPSYETSRWLGSLAQRPAFRDPAAREEAGAAAPDAEALGAALASLLRQGGSGPVADLLLAALRSLPLGAEEDAAAVGLPGLFQTALVLLLGPVPPSRPEVERLLERLDAAGEALDGSGSDGLGLRFLVLATGLAVGVRIGLPVPVMARHLHDLGTLAWRGAAAMALALDAAEEREERVRAALSDPAFAMRAHARVPRRAMAISEAETVRKDFTLEDPLAERARSTLQAAAEMVRTLRADIAALQGMGRLLQEEAGAVLLGPRGA
jgi:hypothetical protein